MLQIITVLPTNNILFSTELNCSNLSLHTTFILPNLPQIFLSCLANLRTSIFPQALSNIVTFPLVNLSFNVYSYIPVWDYLASLVCTPPKDRRRFQTHLSSNNTSAMCSYSTSIKYLNTQDFIRTTDTCKQVLVQHSFHIGLRQSNFLYERPKGNLPDFFS